jgi:Na+-transporting NADH:ubiquinone oxidoreductase subunit E
MTADLASTPFLALLLIFVTAALTDNILLSRFLGLCPCLGVSKKVDASVGLGWAVTFVTACTTALNYLVYHYLLLPLDIAYLRLMVFIVVIAAFVQLVEMVIERLSERLYQSLGIFLPLITVNCAILGTSLFMIARPLTLAQAFVFGFGSGFGWLIAITLIGGIREKIDEKSVPAGLRGPGITLIVIGIMSLAFVVFSGMIKL